MFDAERFASGDREYVREVVREYEPLILVICRSYAVDDDHMLDLAQETWTTVLAKLASFEGKGSFRAWLFRVCTNLCLTDARTRKARTERMRRYSEDMRSMDWKQVDPLAETARRELHHSIYRALPRLSEGEREAVTLRILEGRSAAETARIMGIAPATVRSHIRHAIQRLRTMMEDPDNDLSRYGASP